MAIINHIHRIIFIHIPKNVGASVSRVLARLNSANNLQIGGPKNDKELLEEFRALGLKKHSTNRQIREYLGPDIWEQYFKFVVVRNPYSRAYSLYSFFKNNFRNWEKTLIGEIIQDKYSVDFEALGYQK